MPGLAQKLKSGAKSASLATGVPMPTLIRLLIALVFLGGLGFAGLYVLTLVVDPGQKDMTIKIPQRDLVLTPVLPQKAAPIVEAAPAPKVDDSKAKVVDTQE